MATFSELPASLQHREQEKFDLNAQGEVIVRTSTEGTFTPSGLQTGGFYTEVMIDDTQWWPIPPTPLPNRNAVGIQNFSGAEIKVNHAASLSPLTYKGMRVPNGNERYYDVKDTIIIYARAAPGAGTIALDVEELA